MEKNKNWPDTIFEKAAVGIVAHLSDKELVALTEAMDGDKEDTLLNLLNKVVEKRHPELFV